jgi:hypothetical protein
VKDALWVSQKGFHVPTFSNQVAANLAQLIEYADSFSAGGFKLEPTFAQLEQYDFLSVDCPPCRSLAPTLLIHKDGTTQ